MNEPAHLNPASGTPCTRPELDALARDLMEVVSAFLRARSAPVAIVALLGSGQQRTLAANVPPELIREMVAETFAQSVAFDAAVPRSTLPPN